ncbi:hypothetical protein FAZ95_13810 [Trinickia violacea]|uniref:DUF2635 domain-containing protein n=1 Tax=Trinickia violacea TaxID=2571746 RepID=A0A4P8IWH2_9BURK|nr:hypothetical protein [Trinickia violacea]QCP50159.1 hypothetical protein FAZ95_13810 [Trinickia violacea]
MLTKFVKPTRGIVLMPERGYRELKAEGENVPVNPYYMSLLRFGDIVEVTPPAPAKAVAPVTTAVPTATATVVPTASGAAASQGAQAAPTA